MNIPSISQLLFEFLETKIYRIIRINKKKKKTSELHATHTLTYPRVHIAQYNIQYCAILPFKISSPISLHANLPRNTFNFPRNTNFVQLSFLFNFRVHSGSVASMVPSLTPKLTASIRELHS